MRTVDDIPSTDLLLRPILELLRSGPAPIERDPLVDELIDSLGGVRSVTSIGSVVMVSSDEQRTLRSVVSDRTVDALDCLIRGGAVQRTNGTFPAWTITDVGRDLSDDELQVWFDRFVTGDTVAPQAAPDPGPILLEGTERYRPPAAAWALLAALAVAALVPAIVGGRSTALIDDDFSNPGQLGGWTTDRNARARLAYVDGTFRISVASPEIWFSRRLLGGSSEAVAVQADVGASPDSIRPYVGIACLTDSRLEGYLFAIEPDQGRYSIERLTSDPLTHTTLTVGRDVESVRPGGRTNVIRGECRAGAADTALAMYVNGRLVTTTTDEHGSNAFVGMALAAGGETSRVEGWFDNALMERLNGDLETTGSPEGG